MMIGIVGGLLQGIEAVYLCRHAGYTSLVIDKDSDAPALSIADRQCVMDVTEDRSKTLAVLSECDAVLPALEVIEVLEYLDTLTSEEDIPFLFDIRAYRISSSKESSNRLMSDINFPIPVPWPECGFPMIVKPSCQSGSIGVSAVRNEDERIRALKKVEKLGDVPIQQEFVSGKSVSIEVIGNGKESRSFITTEVVLDSDYDCKQVVCEPGVIPIADDEFFARIGTEIGNALCLNGLMDVEAVYTKKGLRVLEIDARIPSQTPACICAATGINLLEELVSSKFGTETGRVPLKRVAIYEHYLIRGDSISTCGEKEFSHVESPMFLEDFWGADEIITDFRTGKSEWRCMVIFTGDNYQDALWKKKQFIKNTMDNCGLEEYLDRQPEMI